MIRSGAITDRIAALAAPAAEDAGCQIWGVEIEGGGADRVLRVFIDGEDGVSVEHCEQVSRQLSALLDVEDPLEGAYLLEVSSPGMDRILFTEDQVAESVGETLDIKMRTRQDGRQRFVGRLTGFEDGVLVVEPDDGEATVKLPIGGVAKARIVPDFG